ncbi:MAG: hypothetical protein QOF89_2537 [Acidobacteriota bacterium]|nr:hypothetical protein [Acidobacteriota bacterium]
MDSQTTLQQILSRLTGKPVKEHLTESSVSFARDQAVPEALIETLAECAYAGPIRLGRLWLSRLAELEQENAEEENAPCIRHGFLIVGTGLNGDPIAVELATGKMAFISHDVLWEEDYDDFEECVVRTPLGFHEFWVQAADSGDFPVDSYEAETRWSTDADEDDDDGD